jgi:cytochrome c5
MRLAKMAELRGSVCAVALTLVLGGFACKDDDAADDDDHGGAGHDDDHDVTKPIGPITGALCPDDSSLTYDNFGKEFFASYCNRCHAESVTGAARMMAPSDHNFDTQAEIALLGPHIDEYAGSGPESTNTHMPPSGKMPTKEEREKLSEWLACEAP